MMLPIVLTFAASDPTGGAGLQADLLTLHSLGCYGVSVTTGITVQDTTGVQEMMPLDDELVRDQARALLEDMPIAAFKIGVMGSADNITAIAEIVADYPHIPVVLDPVLSSGRGDEFADVSQIAMMRELLLPHVTILTPNSIEARRLIIEDAETQADELARQFGVDVDDLMAVMQHVDVKTLTDDELDEIDRLERMSEMVSLPECAAYFIRLGCEYVLITGTHESTPQVINTLYGESGAMRNDVWSRLTGSYHGSGCTLASAIAAKLAQKKSISEAVQEAQAYTWQTLHQGLRIGMGQMIPDRLYKMR
jgi:hydroxymethylpyrimidine/phosphomethylpyrimidine kinase